MPAAYLSHLLATRHCSKANGALAPGTRGALIGHLQLQKWAERMLSSREHLWELGHADPEQQLPEATVTVLAHSALQCEKPDHQDLSTEMEGN